MTVTERAVFDKRRLLLVEKLESGIFKQGKKVLANTRTKRYCCLGVACEVAIENGLDISKTQTMQWTAKGIVPAIKYGLWGSATLLPIEVQEWYGFYLGSGDPIDYITSRGESIDNVVEMNDRGISFNIIARVMKEQWIDNGSTED